jgi:two-component system, NtrC family, sensor kinase
MDFAANSASETEPCGDISIAAPGNDWPTRRKDDEASSKVLVADDDRVSCELLHGLLSSWGYEVVTAYDGREALKILQMEDGPSLAVLDWMMPEIDGTQICQRIRASRSSRYIFVILVTGRLERQDVIEGLGSGADDYITKPFDPLLLRARLDTANRIKRAENALRAAHKESELFINSVPSILIGTDARGHVTRWNQCAANTFGLAESEVRGKPLKECGIKWLHPDIAGEIESWLRGEQSSRRDNVPFEKAGTRRFLGITISRVNFPDEKGAGLLITGADTTDRKTLEEQLRQAQKLEAIGQLAAGIAHEINTPTQFVSDNTTFLKDSWPAIKEMLCASRALHAESAAGSISAQILSQLAQSMAAAADLDYLMEEIPRAIDQSLEGVQRVAKIVRAMKEFSHPGSEEKHAIDINRAIETTVTVARNEWKYVADVQTNFDSTLPMVPCLAGEFNQAILNLLINAAHAIHDAVGDGSKGKGVITIETKREGEWAEIQIKDTGTGIPEAIRGRIFEPFFTTKDVGKGTGQGLTLAHSLIVKKHGGQIWFESEVGKGTTFFLRLPIAPAEQAES